MHFDTYNWSLATNDTLAKEGVREGLGLFRRQIRLGKTSGSAIYILVGAIEDDAFIPLADGYTKGGLAHRHLAAPGTGRLETVLRYGKDSDEAFGANRDDPFFLNDPFYWAGGVYRAAVVTPKGHPTYRKVFAAAAAGDHGLTCKQVAKVAVENLACGWEMRVAYCAKRGLPIT